MTGLSPGMITFLTGLIAGAALMIVSNLYHRRKRIYSFVIKESESEIVIKRNPVTNAFNSAAHFFLYSMLTVITYANENEKTVFRQLAVIYFICLLVVVIEYYIRASFRIIVDKHAFTIKTRETSYLLRETEFEISDGSFWQVGDITEYGLYIKTGDGKRRLLYGNSVLWDIKELKNQVESRLDKQR